MNNRAEEDYIKVIYELTVEKEKNLIKSTELSEYFGYTDQSVNEMIKKLKKKHLVSFLPYKGISLTSEGKAIAIRMIQAHRIWEVFLAHNLGFSWENLHEDSEKLEHASGEKLIESLYQYLGKPKVCPHGNPIPDLSGHTEKMNQTCLLDFHVGQRFMITHVLDTKPLLEFLNERKIRLYDQFEIMQKDTFNQMMEIQNDTESHLISFQIARMLFGDIVV